MNDPSLMVSFCLANTVMSIDEIENCFTKCSYYGKSIAILNVGQAFTTTEIFRIYLMSFICFDAFAVSCCIQYVARVASEFNYMIVVGKL